MKRLLGNKVHVFLKSDDEIVSGILFDVDDGCVYIQSSVETFVVIPKENVKYYTSSSPSELKVRESSDSGYAEESLKSVEGIKQPEINALDVYVDQIFIVKIPVPPTFDLSAFNDNIMRVTLGNPDVQVALSDKIQKSVEYFPGQIHIITDGGNYTTPAPVEPNTQPPQDSFAMSNSGSPVSSYLNPSQMVSRLNKVAQKKPEEVKNGE
jgi:hypothetical protein